MSTVYKTPGVYIEEIAKLPPSVAQVETAIPVFIGKTEGGKENELVRIQSMAEFEQKFGGAPQEEIKVIFAAKVAETSVQLSDPSARNHLYYSVLLFYANGGGVCYIFKGGWGKAEEALEKNSEPTLIVIPGGEYTAHKAALAHCQKMQNRFVIIDTALTGNGANKDSGELRNAISGTTDQLKYGAAYFPNLQTSIVPPNRTLVDGNDNEITRDIGDQLYNQILAKINQEIGIIVPPSGAIAGLYARVDGTRGVWKAPANESLVMVKGVDYAVTNSENDALNIDATAGKSINVIRAFPGRGLLVWGARTLAGNDNEWRYVSVRRFFIMAEQSIKNATERFVFEPNDANTWVKVKAMIENFLTLQWRQGALAGAKAEHAFYVKVGLNQTMTAVDILEGRMIVEVGMAVVRPAEFIILQFSHKMQES